MQVCPNEVYSHKCHTHREMRDAQVLNLTLRSISSPPPGFLYLFANTDIYLQAVTDQMQHITALDGRCLATQAATESGAPPIPRDAGFAARSQGGASTSQPQSGRVRMSNPRLTPPSLVGSLRQPVDLKDAISEVKVRLFAL